MFGSNFEKVLKNFEKMGYYGKEVAEHLIEGNDFMGDWRTRELTGSYISMSLNVSKKKDKIEEDLSKPIYMATKKASDVLKVMKKTEDNEELEEDYISLMNSSTNLMETYSHINEKREYFIKESEGYLSKGRDVLKGFMELRVEDYKVITNEFDKLIGEIKDVRKRFKRTKRVDPTLLENILKKNIYVAKEFAERAKKANTEYETGISKLEDYNSKIEETYGFVEDIITSKYQDYSYQDSLAKILELENKYPTLRLRFRRGIRKLRDKTKKIGRPRTKE
ncbi:MAG: hypothetical protein J7L45_03060 [Candidatus Aenigmarchaeota archaeon]|nr:hypothetical protein [Candidatus Aenigmarchaeota archaeon]